MAINHLQLAPEQVAGSTIALLPGDPERVEKIASHLEDARHLATAREFTSWIGFLGGRPVLVTSTGIGGPSLSIAVEELAQLGLRTFVRVGTAGAIRPGIAPRDVVISTGAVRLEGASRHFAPVEFPAVADHEVTAVLAAAAGREGVRFHLGITVSSDTFYPGQERHDTFTGYVLPELRGSLEKWRSLGARAYEMEAATLFVMCAVMGLRAGAVCGVVVNRSESEAIDPAAAEEAEQNAIRVAVAAASALPAE